jgi:anti-sigma factor RsiW
MKSFNNNELLAYLDEALPADTMAAIEDALRQDVKLAARLTEIIARRDSGTHSLGEIWRRCRLSCATREQLGSYLLGAMSDEEAGYVAFHTETIGCRYCQANLADLKAQQSAAANRSHLEKTGQRRKKYFQSSAGHLQAAKR